MRHRKKLCLDSPESFWERCWKLWPSFSGKSGQRWRKCGSVLVHAFTPCKRPWAQKHDNRIISPQPKNWKAMAGCVHWCSWPLLQPFQSFGGHRDSGCRQWDPHILFALRVPSQDQQSFTCMERGLDQKTNLYRKQHDTKTTFHFWYDENSWKQSYNC